VAKLKANVRPRRSKCDSRIFVGTCSNCKVRKASIVKIRGSQVCVRGCQIK